MIPISTVLPTYSILTKGSIYSKKNIEPLRASLDWKQKELELIDNFMSAKIEQSIYKLCAILEVDPQIKPIMFFEKLKQFKLKQDAIEKHNQELNNQR